MTRKNFSKATIRRRKEHAGGVCEWIDAETQQRCAAPLDKGKWHCDHDDPDGLTGQPTFENARCLCVHHHKLKTARDVAMIARAKRRYDADQGIRTAPSRPLQGRKFPVSERRAKREPKQPLPAREIYR